MSVPPDLSLPGRAREVARALGERLRIVDFYDAAGSAVYERLTRDDHSEVAEFVAWVRRCGGPVLELACGAGRLTLPLLSCGHEVVAVDNSPTMLQLLAQRLDTPAGRRLAPRLTTVVGDMTRLDLGRQFRVVVLGTTTISLLDVDQRRALFQRVAAHLDEDGRFFVSTLEFEAPRDLAPAESVQTFADGDAQCTLMEYVDFVESRRWVNLLRESPDDEPLLVTTTTHVLDTAELEEEMVRAGLAVVGRQVVTTAPFFDASPRHTILLEVCRPGGRR